MSQRVRSSTTLEQIHRRHILRRSCRNNRTSVDRTMQTNFHDRCSTPRVGQEGFETKAITFTFAGDRYFRTPLIAEWVVKSLEYGESAENPGYGEKWETGVAGFAEPRDAMPVEISRKRGLFVLPAKKQ